MNPPDISIIIITKNDPGVEETLASLTHIRYPASTEIIVVDASVPTHRLSSIQKKYDSVLWVTYDGAHRNKLTYPEQRNVGVANASGKFLVWLDCGCVPRVDWLEKLYASLQRSDNVIASRIVGNGRSSVFEINPSLLVAPLIERKEAGGLGLGFSRDLYDAVGGFDERFSHGEDVDFTWMARRLGYRILFNTEAIVAHDWEDWHKEIWRAFKYGSSRATLYKKHRWLWKQLFGHDLDVLVYSGFLLGLPLIYFFPLYPCILVIPFVKNIRRKPFLVIAKNLIYGAGVIRGTVGRGYIG